MSQISEAPRMPHGSIQGKLLRLTVCLSVRYISIERSGFVANRKNARFTVASFDQAASFLPHNDRRNISVRVSNKPQVARRISSLSPPRNLVSHSPLLQIAPSRTMIHWSHRIRSSPPESEKEPNHAESEGHPPRNRSPDLRWEGRKGVSWSRCRAAFYQ